MTRSDDMIPEPDGDVPDITVRYGTMVNRYRETQPAINKPSQDTLPNRD